MAVSIKHRFVLIAKIQYQIKAQAFLTRAFMVFQWTAHAEAMWASEYAIVSIRVF